MRAHDYLPGAVLRLHRQRYFQYITYTKRQIVTMLPRFVIPVLNVELDPGALYFYIH